MPKFTVKLPRMTEQQVTVMCHLALGSKVRRNQIRATPPRYEYPLSWVLDNGYRKHHYKVATKTINALMRKGMVRLRVGEMVASRVTMAAVRKSHPDSYEKLVTILKGLNAEHLGKKAEEKAEAQARHENDAEEGRPDRDDSELVMSDTEVYNALASRLMGAFNEVNAALQEAFALDTMTVRVGALPLTEGGPRQYHPMIYRLTHFNARWHVKARTTDAGEPIMEASYGPEERG